MTTDAIMKDAQNCARYLLDVRSDDNWVRFDVGVDEFLMRHAGEVSLSTLRERLADAYNAVAPGDADGHRQILKVTV